jgi:hypothetical protein
MADVTAAHDLAQTALEAQNQGASTIQVAGNQNGGQPGGM